MIDFSRAITAEQKREEEYRSALEVARAQRRAAYQVESDPIRLEIAYDALIHGVEADFGTWAESVTAIKARYPLPPVTE